jgi:hypothetical protein
MRVTRYLRLEKNIAASDTGGIIERWRYGRRLLMDDTATTPNGNLRHGLLARLIPEAAAAGYKLSEREIQYRLQCAKAYLTEAEIRTAGADFVDWTALREAGFPPVELPPEADPGEPHDPRDADEKWRDFRNAARQREQENPGQGALFELPMIFSHDTYSPKTPLSSLVAACDESERMTRNFIKKDEERRAYTMELIEAAGGNLGMTWYEAEARRQGLAALGLDSWDEFWEITRDFFERPHDDGHDDGDE